MSEPIRVVITGTPQSGALEVAKGLKDILGLPLADLMGMSEEEISRELKRRNGDHESTLFIVSPECRPTMGVCSIFLCGSDATKDTNIEGFTHILYLGKMTKADVVFLLRDTMWRRFPVLRRRC